MEQEHDLEKLNQIELDQAIEKHLNYLKGKRGGARVIFKFKDLTGLTFRGADLSQADFTGSILAECNLSQGKFRGVSFYACDMRDSNMEKADLSFADLRGAYVAGADMSGANMHKADLREGKVMQKGEDGFLEDRPRESVAGDSYKTVFTGARMANVDLSGARASSVDFTDADLSNIRVVDADLSDSKMSGANLSGSNFTGSKLSNVTIDSAIMTDTVLDAAELQGVDFKSATTNESISSSLAELEKSLDEILNDHTQWVETVGKFGKQLDLSGYDLRKVENLRSYPLTAIKAIGSNFLGQDLQAAHMQSAKLDRCDFRSCNMKYIDLRGSSLKNALLQRADLTGANMAPLEFNRENEDKWHQCVDLSGAKLRYAVFVDVCLHDGKLVDTDLSFATFINCDLRRCDFSGAKLEAVKIRDCRTDDVIADAKNAALFAPKD